MATAAQAGHTARQAAAQTAQHRYVQLLGRIGLVAYGLVHLTIAWLAVQVATGSQGSGTSTDKAGALQTLAAQPGGQALLWIITIGMAVLTLWRLTEAVVGRRSVPADRRTRKRVEHAIEAVVFGALAFTAFKLVTGAGAGSGGGKTFTAELMSQPFGRLLVGAAGVALVVIAAFVVIKGVKKKFLEDLDLSSASPTARKAAIRLGQFGYPALGVSYGILGLLIVAAAVTHKPNTEVGLDAALATLAAQPYGTILLLVVAVGLACFGVYCLFDARFRRA